MNDVAASDAPLYVPPSFRSVSELKQLFDHPSCQDRYNVPARKLLLHLHYPNNEHQELVNLSEKYLACRQITDFVLGELQKSVNFQSFASFVEKRLFGKDLLEDNYFDLLRSFFFDSFFFGIFGTKPSPADIAIYQASSNFHWCFKGQSIVRKGLRLRALRRVETLLASSKSSIVGEMRGCQALDDRDIAHHVLGVFFFTGITQLTELISHITLPLAQLMKLPKGLAELHAEPTFSRSIVRETLRLFPLLLTTSRVVTHDVGFANHQLRRGQLVFINFRELQQVGWDSPRAWDPWRWLPSAPNTQQRGLYLPFGLGHRVCPASEFSMMLAQQYLEFSSCLQIEMESFGPHYRRLSKGIPITVSHNLRDHSFIFTYRNDKSVDLGDRNIWGGTASSLKAVCDAQKVARRPSLRAFAPLVSNLRAYKLSDHLGRKRSDPKGSEVK